jgi:hypothetical protein
MSNKIWKETFVAIFEIMPQHTPTQEKETIKKKTARECGNPKTSEIDTYKRECRAAPPLVIFPAKISRTRNLKLGRY